MEKFPGIPQQQIELEDVVPPIAGQSLPTKFRNQSVGSGQGIWGDEITCNLDCVCPVTNLRFRAAHSQLADGT